MRDPSSETFARTLAGLSPSALAAFVADLWAARGYETRVETADSGTRIVCTCEDRATTVLLPERRSVFAPLGRAVRTRLRPGGHTREGGGGGPTTAGETIDTDAADANAVDIVVSPVPDARAEALAAAFDARVYDARSLSDLALYGLDRAEADAVFRRHLGDGIEAIEPEPTPDEPARPPDAPATSWTRLRGDDGNGHYALVVAVVGLVLVAALLVTGGIGFVGVGDGSAAESVGDRDRPSTASDTGEAEGFGDVDPFGTGPPDGSANDRDDATDSTLAPGLTAEGVTSPDVLAEAHARRVDGRSYVWRVTYTERSDEEVARVRTVHRIRSATVFRVDVETTGVAVTDPGYFAPRPAYADGDRRYVRYDRARRRSMEARDHYAGHAEAALSRLLHANESSVRAHSDTRGTVRYQVSLSGSPDPAKTGYRATAVVAPDGVVHVVDARWVERGSNVTVSVRATYDFVDDPNVSRPDWVPPASETPPENATRSPTPVSGAA
ncbi:hypothetical protein C2R22_02795 [Salinigranum rubrum]|uniref:Uncharacterized protein n=1 Tax=Salinigranum rubrum TaxID=755307 RepID=A0A2I8VFK7_9EURY|nr:hypothetical protein [Salinigranum rubrum]AUV80717.1 hypothetical protein C2R22_02795 [Salinigranum rubrum]